jgi:hypothetical protein
MSQLKLLELPPADAKVAHETPIQLARSALVAPRLAGREDLTGGTAGRAQRIVLVAPPSMKRSAPWIWAARGEARNATRSATSSGSP